MQRISTLILRGIFCFFVFLTPLFNSEVFAQCAGTDASFELCNKGDDTINGTIDLFALLGPDAETGGIWRDDDNSSGLNTTTGILNTYFVNRGGVFRYTYTVDASSCVDNTSTVTVTLGSFPGRSNNNAVACSDDNFVNLFQFTGSSPSPTLDGAWTSSTAPTGTLSGSIFNAAGAGVGIYTFMYTVPAIDDCPSSFSTVKVEVVQAPESGIADQPIYCETDDLSAFTNFDLRTALTGEDDGGIWTETTTNEISGFTDSTVNIENLRDTYGPGTYSFTYTVNPLNPACNPSSTTVSILIEDVVDFTGATFDITTPGSNPAAICEDDLPYQAVGQISVNPQNVPDGDYEITYTTSPVPNAGVETLTVSFVNGKANFNINPDFLTATGEVSIEITQVIDPNTQLQCQVQISGLEDRLSITALPDLSDSVVTVSDPLCLGEDATLTLADGGATPAIELVDGVYDIAFTLTGPGINVSGSESATVTGGLTQYTLNTAVFGQAGDYTITITQVTNSNGCSTLTNQKGSFTISPLPDAQSLSLNVDDTCEGDDLYVNIQDGETIPNLADGNYTFIYSVTGAINATDFTAENVDFTGGMAAFIIPSNIVIAGFSTVSITGITNTATGCAMVDIDGLETTFNIVVNPDLSITNISIPSVCENEDVIVTFSDSAANIPDATYSMLFTLSGANVSGSINTTISFEGGFASFTIPESLIPNTGNTTFTITNLKNVGVGCLATGLPVSVSFDIYKNPDLSAAAITTADICLGEDAVQTITGANVADGDYTLIYTTIGANTLADTAITVSFVAGTGSFTIPASQFTASGNTQIDITEIIDINTPNNCNAVVSNLAVALNINPLPDVSNLNLVVPEQTCLGEDLAIIIIDDSGNLTDGDYEVAYELDDSNIASQTVLVTVESGNAGFTIPSTLLTNPGFTDVKVLSFTNTATGCTSIITDLSKTTTIVSPPNLTDASITINDECFNETVTASLNAPDLADGSYNIVYTLNGANTGSYIAGTVSSSGGVAEIILDAEALVNTGTTDIVITTITNETTSCFTDGLTISGSFVINELPTLSDENLEVASTCKGDDSTLFISAANLADGDYTIDYTISGVNTAQNTTTVTVTGGEANIDLDENQLATVGTSTLTITSITSLTTSCSNVLAAAVDFEIFPIPELDSSELSVLEACFEENALVTITGASGLADGDYTILYSISGVNISADNEVIITVTNGESTFEIASNLLTEIGQNTLIITQIDSENACSSGIIAATADFEILPLPDAQGLVMQSTDICLFENELITFSGAIALNDAQYVVTYQLEGANTSAPITENIIFTNGEAVITLDATLLLNAGETSLNILDIQNFVTLCSAINLDTAPVLFTVQNPDPPALASGGDIFCINDEPRLIDLARNVTPASGITWYASETGNDILSTDILLQHQTTYYASFTSTETGCESSVRLAVTVDLTGCDNVFVPEGFSPNNDGINDTFEVQNIDFIYPKYQIEIFNRDGITVFKGNAANPSWDGNSNQNRFGGKILPNGVYFYIINYNDGKTERKQGKLYLNR
ncbi:gliding motility-associated C-terminal domain-containing protein [Leeuwenhoekiella sp. A16]|uniref:T9SS type B sorting domain-containing protein n=1 Tax=unclassified Leeuwenhoekiella TaxID=2615029 RepID=UPI003A80B003